MSNPPPFKRNRLWLGCMAAWLPVRRVWARDEARFRVLYGDHFAAVEYFGG